jgi:hypothetical protein
VLPGPSFVWGWDVVCSLWVRIASFVACRMLGPDGVSASVCVWVMSVVTGLLHVRVCAEAVGASCSKGCVPCLGR